MRHCRGTTFIELSVGAAIMGLLFMCGLQLFSSLGMVEARLVSNDSAFSMEPLLLKARLKQAFQEARVLTIENQTVHYVHHGEEQRLRFIQEGLQWVLMHNSKPLGRWQVYDGSAKPCFQLVEQNLLEIGLPNETVTIWLRNQL